MDRVEVKFAADEVDAKTGEFAGHGAIFGNIDSHGDVIPPGAFSETLLEWEKRGRLPSMKLMHGTALNPFSGDDLPVGKWLEMREDGKGLFVKGRLSGLDTDHGRRIHGLMKDGILDGLSIGYKARRATRLTGPAKRQLDAVSLIEVSLVDEPSNDRARVTAIKSFSNEFWRSLEAKCRDELNLSSAGAVSAVAIFKKHLREGGDDELLDLSREADGEAIKAALRRNLSILK